MSLKKEGKLRFLKDVREKKDILFGAFSDKLTKQDKIEAWKTIHEKYSALGVVPFNKDYTYTRDTYWQNLKKYTMKKVDNMKKTGSGGGQESKFNETENIILDILGRDSPLVDGLSSKGTWDTININDIPIVSNTMFSEIDNVQIEENILNLNSSTSNTFQQKKFSKKHNIETTDEFQKLKEKKMKLLIELMEKDSYFKSLQILKLEKELGLPSS